MVEGISFLRRHIRIEESGHSPLIEPGRRWTRAAEARSFMNAESQILVSNTEKRKNVNCAVNYL